MTSRSTMAYVVRRQAWAPESNAKGRRSSELPASPFCHATGNEFRRTVRDDDGAPLYVADNANDRVMRWDVGAAEGVLVAGGNVLLLDEPTNDLDVDTLRALEEALLDFAGCVVVISHDRWFLDRIATHILAFEGDSHVEWFEGNYEDYEKDRKRRLGAEAARPQRLRYRKLTG